MSVFAKLNLKDHDDLLIVNAPASFEPEIAALDDVRVHRAVAEMKTIGFSLAFVTAQVEVDRLAQAICRKVVGDAIVWFAYPKQTSKRYACDFNRDTGWAVLGRLGFEGVRGVAIDEDWSALRFRRVEFIKGMARDPKRAMTTLGRARVAKKKE